MKRAVWLALAALVAVLAASGLWINVLVARLSVPAAVYMTLIPYPFHLEASYRSGKVQGIVIGDEWHKAVDHLMSQSRCLVLRENELMGKDQLQVIDEKLLDRNGRVILRCRGAGTVWNVELIVSDGKIIEVGLAGGMWMA